MSGDDPYRTVATVRLKPGREAALLRGHPWIYRGALADPVPDSFAPMRVVRSDRRALGTALPGGSGGSLALRVVAAGTESWDRTTLLGRLAAAVDLRRRCGIDANAYRIVHAEGDRLPGLVVDRYADHAVVQLFEPAWDAYLEDLAAGLERTVGIPTVLVRRAARQGSVAALRGSVPSQPVVIREGRVSFPVDLTTGQKTGFFLDQRENRRRCAELATGGSLLNLFSYSGGFAVSALVSGASRAVNVDASADALTLARQAYRINGLEADEACFVAGDAFAVARDLVASGVRFDTVVVDPPAFVKRKTDLGRGFEGYRDINLQALRLVAPGGVLVTCSCSALVGSEQFESALLAAAVDADRSVQVVERRSAGPDHPVLLSCPETRHLKVLICRVA